VFALYGLALALAPLLGTVSLGWIGWQRKKRRLIPRPALGGLTVGASCLIGLALLEGCAAYFSMASRRLPWLPDLHDLVAADQEHNKSKAARSRPDVVPSRRDENQLRLSEVSESGAETYLVVIGESSGRGEPYDPWLSVGQIVGWQLERVFPGRRFKVEILARPGLNLRQAVERLQRLRRRPDAILVYSGHNEFQSRYSWSRSVPHYRRDPPPRADSLVRRAAQWSSVCSLVDLAMEQQRLSFGPARSITRPLVDLPCCTADEYTRIVTDFREQFDQFVTYCEQIGAVPLAVIPPGNDGRYPPCRSILDPETAQDERDRFAREFESTKVLAASDPDLAIAAYRRLVEWQPGFAEVHFRLAALLELAGNYAEARAHYIQASDLDGLPLRCPAPLRNVFRDVAAAYPMLILVDGPRVLQLASRHGIVDDELIQDGQHPTLRGYLALAQDVLEQLSRRRAFPWAGNFTVAAIDASECAAHFGVDAARWAEVCRRAASFYNRTAHVRHDPRECLAIARRYERAAAAILSGTPPEATGVPGVGVSTNARGSRYVLRDQH